MTKADAARPRHSAMHIDPPLEVLADPGETVVYGGRRKSRGLVCRVLAVCGDRLKLRPLSTVRGEPIEEARAFWAGRRALRVLDARASAGLRIGPAS